MNMEQGGGVRKFWEVKHREGYRTDEGPLNVFTDFLKRYQSEIVGGKGLDIGSGNGRNLLAVAKESQMTGVDFDENALAQAKEKLNDGHSSATLVRGDFKKLPFQADSFDFAYALQAYQYAGTWKDIEQSFAEASRVIRKNGIFLVRVPSVERDMPAHAEIIIEDDIPKGLEAGVTYKLPGDIIKHHFTVAELKWLGKHHGLQVLEEPWEEEEDETDSVGKVVHKARLQVVFKKKDDPPKNGL